METACVHLMAELRKHGPRVLWNTAQPNKDDLNNCHELETAAKESKPGQWGRLTHGALKV